MITRAYRYALLDPSREEPIDEQLLLRNRMWNVLVEVEREYQTKRKQILDFDSLPDDDDKRDKELARRKRIHKKPLSEIGEARKAQAITTRKDFKDQKLFWGNYNTVAKIYGTARGEVLKRRKLDGSPSELQIHYFDGTGSITLWTNQAEKNEEGERVGLSPAGLLRGTYAAAYLEKVSPEKFDALASNKGRNRRGAAPASTRREQRRYLLHLRINGKDTITWPLILHRPLPDQGRIQTITVKKSRVGSRLRWHVSFSMKGIDAPQFNPKYEACGVDIGWRSEKRGLHVATCVGSDGVIVHYWLSNMFLHSMGYVSDLESQLADEANDMHETLRQWSIIEPLREKWERALRAKSATTRGKRLSELALSWREVCPGTQPDYLAELDSWRKHAKRQYNAMSNLRDKLHAQRLDAYRCVASDITTKYQTVVINGMDLSAAAEIPRTPVRCKDGEIEQFKARKNAEKYVATHGGEILAIPARENELYAQARLQRQRANVHELRKWIQMKAEIAVEAFNSHICSVCEQPLGAKSADAMVTCQSCGAMVHSDENTALNFCREAASAPVLPGGPGTARTNKINILCASNRIEQGKKRTAKSSARRAARRARNGTTAQAAL